MTSSMTGYVGSNPTMSPRIASAALACSTVAIGPADARLVAYSYDTSATGAGFVFVNPHGARRTSIMEGDPPGWDVVHGSITFNQMGFGMPTETDAQKERTREVMAQLQKVETTGVPRGMEL